jgi:hypothetical protein
MVILGTVVPSAVFAHWIAVTADGDPATTAFPLSRVIAADPRADTPLGESKWTIPVAERPAAVIAPASTPSIRSKLFR